MSAAGQQRLDRLAFLAFCATGAALPLFAFPPVTVAGKAVDLATLLAAAFLVLRLRALPTLRGGRLAWGVAAAVVPLLALAGGAARAGTFEPRQFGASYLHWLLVVGVFAMAAGLPLDRRRWHVLVGVQTGAGLAVALFCWYQLIGRSRGWAGTGPVLLPFQRGPFVGGTLGGYERPTSFLLEPSYMGIHLVWAAVFPLSLLIDRGQARGTRLACAAAVAILVSAVLASASLGAIADLLAVGAVALVRVAGATGVRRWRALLFGAVAALAVAGATAALWSSGPVRAVRARIEASVAAARAGDYAALGGYRAGLHAREVRVFARDPLTGAGIGQYRLVAAAMPGYQGTIQVVSGWLGSAAEMGVGGPLVLVAAMALARRRSRAAPVALLLTFLAVNQLHAASYIELTFWYPLACAAMVARWRPEGDPVRAGSGPAGRPDHLDDALPVAVGQARPAG